MSHRKRSMPDTEGNVLVPSSHVVDANSMLDQQQQQQYSNRKRCCGTPSNPAPGELQADEVATYLHGLSSHLANNQLQHASTVLGAAGWQAFAELNILLARCLSSGALTDNLLRSYSRFTLQPRQQLWERYSKYAADRGSLSGQQLELLRFLLGCVLDPFPDCALTEVTLDLPPWMVSWASRWGMYSSSNRITLIRLEAYAPIDPCSSSSGAMSAPRNPARVLFVPAMV